MKDILRENKRVLAIGTYMIVLFMILFNFKTFVDIFNGLLVIFTPLFIGVGIAFVLNLPMVKIEKLLKKLIKQDKFKGIVRTLSIIITIILTLIVLLLVFSIIIPKIIDSLMLVVNNFNVLLDNTIKSINGILKGLNVDVDLNDISFVKEIKNISWRDLLNVQMDSVLSIANGVIDNAMAFFNSFMDWFLGFCLSLYMLGSKEKLLHQVKKVIYAFLKNEHADEVMRIAHKANGIFAKFVGGQLVNCIMVAIVCYITYLIMGLPMPELNAALVGVFSIIPVFGPMFAMLISFVLTFAFNPTLAVIFIIVFQVVTNLESNILYPRVVGSSIGLPGLWVLLSIFVLGDLFGIVGMILAVPVTALAYALFTEYIRDRLKKKKISNDDARLKVNN